MKITKKVLRFINGSFHNTELPIKKYEYDEDIFTAESSSSLEVVAEVHGKETQPITGRSVKKFSD